MRTHCDVYTKCVMRAEYGDLAELQWKAFLLPILCQGEKRLVYHVVDQLLPDDNPQEMFERKELFNEIPREVFHTGTSNHLFPIPPTVPNGMGQQPGHGVLTFSFRNGRCPSHVSVRKLSGWYSMHYIKTSRFGRKWTACMEDNAYTCQYFFVRHIKPNCSRISPPGFGAIPPILGMAVGHRL